MAIGPPVLFENMLIRKMLELADIKKDDMFFDLGCGHAQNLIIAASEYGVRNCIGVDASAKRARNAREIVAKKSLDQRITIVNEFFEFVDLSDADVVFYGLSPNSELIEKFIDNLKPGCRLLYYINCPQPAILPDKIDYPFYRSDARLREANSELQWLSSMVPAAKSLTSGEYWNEIILPYNGQMGRAFFGSGDLNYKRSLQRLLKKRLA